MDEDNTPGAEQAVPAGRLSVTASTADGIRVLTVAGEIDHDTGDVLHQALDPSGTPSPRVVVDMRQVTFMDSVGINLFITAHRSLAQVGGWLRLVSVGTTVMRTFQIVGIDEFLDIRETREEALSE
ncbi:STAS domain-containing protein [Streptomyces sp. DT190]|jgi:stage II sporulation protein AA (anti-sigma F factor antagonist)|uniref:STAS domain-containing protein n=1 Tax=unclassified Streptomyces TaxID=2593676 RepID=UPI003CE6FDFA